MMGQDVHDRVARRLPVVALRDGQLVLAARSFWAPADHIELTFELNLP